jgi:hypothetical protein
MAAPTTCPNTYIDIDIDAKLFPTVQSPDMTTHVSFDVVLSNARSN